MDRYRDAHVARRSSIDKPPVAMPPINEPFERLPDEIIEQILHATTPDGFASLVVLNRKWRATSQRPHLYIYHLARCPSYAASHISLPPSDQAGLPLIRRLFAREVKRNLFQSYLRPAETVVKLVSNSISSSSCPGGEGMQFGASPRGHHVLAYNSARIYVIDVRGPSLDIKRELKIIRRPVSACITDDASFLAVLSNEMQVDLYDLQESPPRRKNSIILDNSPRTIALSPCGSVLAAAYEGGIEVSSLNPGALSTERRSVKCDAVDSLAFSFDGTQILGTTIHSSPSNTVILTAPYYDPGTNMADDNLSAMWTTSILFPNTSRDCSHAVLLQEGCQEEASWTFAYDRSFETFRAVRIDDLRNGTTYFTGPVPKATSQAKLLPCTLPSTTYNGDLVSAGFQGKEIWLYGVPKDLDADPEVALSNSDSLSAGNGPGRSNSGRSNPSRHSSSRGHEPSGVRVAQWQILCDKLRNNFVAGHKVSDVAGVSNMKWVSDFGNSSFEERLVVAARGVAGPRLATEEEDIDFVDGGRITLLDFDYGLTDGTRREITIEVGTDDAEALEEEQRDMETDVAIVRRRTVAQRRGGRNALLRAATTAAREVAVPPMPQDMDADDDDPLVPRRMGQHPANRRTPSGVIDAEDDGAASIEEQEALDAPYSHASPRSGTTLRRAATAAAVNRTMNPRTADGRPIEYRRADGRAEHPHESDADGWVPPPPPYQRDDDVDLPAFLRAPTFHSPLPEVPRLPATMPSSFSHRFRPQVERSAGGLTSATLQGPLRTFDLHVQRRPSHHRTASDSTTMSRYSRTSEVTRPRSSPSAHVDFMDDIYDVSPPGSPRFTIRRPTEASPLTSEVAVASTPPAGSPTTARPQTANTASTTHATERVGSSSSEVHVSPASDDQSSLPILSVHTSPSRDSNMGLGSDGPPPPRRLSNAQTWPLGPLAHDAPSANFVNAEPFSTPVPGNPMSNLASALPPRPEWTQLASLNRRISRGNPRRLSGGVPALWSSTGDGRVGEWTSYQPQQRLYSMSSSAVNQQETDAPLIISTPTGVAGAYDAPGRQMSGRRGENTIFAPVPRRPRPNHWPSSRPTVERLEHLGRMDTIHSYRSGNGYYGNHENHGNHGNHASHGNTGNQGNNGSQREGAYSFLPSWLYTPSSPSRGSPNGINRRRSRAERSAARNMQDARRRGWKAKGRKKKKTSEYGGASTVDWTDATMSTSGKEKKCVVM